MTCRVIVAALFVVVNASESGAQSVRGTITDRGTSSALPGVVVQLVDDAGVVVGRTITDASGAYHVAAPGPGVYRVRTLRIGFRPATSDGVTLVAGRVASQPLSLGGVPFRLDTVRVAGKNACQVRPDSAMATFAVWEQVRTALNAAHVTSVSRALTARVVTYDRALEPNRERVVRQGARVREGMTQRPWKSLSADSLRRGGYVVAELDGSTTYYAPDLLVLLSDQFVEDHCLRFADKSDATRLGIAFEPTRDRRTTPDIEGTLWLDRKSGELREMLFRYVNVTREQSFGRSGGLMEFARMKNGSFVISRWNIRMPQLDTRMVPQPGLRVGGATQAERYVRELRVEGGELALVRLGKDTLWSQPPMALAGRILDSLSAKGVAGTQVSLRGTTLGAETDARGAFRIPDVLPGDYLLDVQSPELRKLGATHSVPVSFVDASALHDVRIPTAAMMAQSLCAGARDGIISGTVAMSGDSIARGNVKVVAEWSEIRMITTGPPGQRGGSPTQGFLQRNRWTDARTDGHGHYRLCGVPLNTAIKVRVEHDSASASIVDLRIASDERFARAEFTLHRGISAGALLTGVVLHAGTGRPLPEVEISLSGLERSTYTNDQGVYRLTDIPPGTRQLTARRVGYRVFADSLAFTARQSIDRSLALSPVTELKEVTVESSRLRSFEEHRALGLGVFMTRADMDKLETRQLTSAMREVAGANVVRGRTGQGWITSSRVRPSGRELFGDIPPNVYCPEEHEKVLGMPCACYAQVYLDEMLMNPGVPTLPFNLSELSADRIESVEWYATPLVTPLKYSSRASECGVLVIHTRRDPDG